MDFGDIDDKQLQEKLTNFHKSVENIESVINKLLTSISYNELSLKEKTDYDLFMAFALNTLFWLHLRSRGIDPNKNEVKNQLARVKEYMLKAKKAHERNTIRPTINKEVAARFVKHGIKHPRETVGPPNKKIKFSD